MPAPADTCENTGPADASVGRHRPAARRRYSRAVNDGLIGGERLIGHSPPIRRLRAQLAGLPPAKSNVFVLGETGTGKELVAELIHLNGSRSAKPLVCLNTAAIPDSLLENELFGHERGAFTGATRGQDGKLAAAQGGTVFLDEIGDLEPPIQAKLLRAIEGKSVYRLGGTAKHPDGLSASSPPPTTISSN